MTFRRLPTEIEGVILIEPTVHGDERGFLVESFRENEFRELGIDVDFVQDNHSRSSGRVLRGIHMHLGSPILTTEPYAAAVVKALLAQGFVHPKRDAPAMQRR